MLTAGHLRSLLRASAQGRHRRALAIGLGVSLVATLSVVSAADSAQAGSENLALHRPVAVSSTQDTTLVGANALDGDPHTRWASRAGSDPQWIAVDLGANLAIRQVVLRWDSAYASGYQIGVSMNGTSWQTLDQTTTGDGGTDDISLTVSARWIRMYGTARATTGGYSLQEFEVYGAAASATPSPTASAGATEDLARGRPVASSSTETPELAAWNAVDGNPATRWASREHHDPEWFAVDLGSDQAITQVVLSWEAAYATSFRIDVSSDAMSWRPVVEVTNGSGGTETLGVNTVARYVRMFGTARGTRWGYSLWEFDVRGAPSAVPTAGGQPTTSPTAGPSGSPSQPAEPTPSATVSPPTPPSPSTEPPTTPPNGAGEQRVQAYVTGYSFFDNTPPGSANISNPVLHQTAGGNGTFDDPTTVAVGHVMSGGQDTPDWAPGTRIYIPNLRRYFIVEDTCGDGSAPQNGPCHTGFPSPATTWFDIWVGGQGGSSGGADACMDAITDVWDVIVNPQPNYATVAGDVYGGGGCTQQFGNRVATG